MRELPQPFFFPNLFLAIEACQAANENGVRVLLDGTDGDTTVGHGYDRFFECANAHQWSSFVREANSFVQRFGHQNEAYNSYLVNDFAMPELQRLAARLHLVPMFIGINTLGRRLKLPRKHLLKRAWQGRIGNNTSIPSFSHLSQDFVGRVRGRELFAAYSSEINDYPIIRRSIQSKRLNSGAIPFLLEILDRIAATNNIEYRFPFCDRELIEFCLSVPTQQQLKNGWTRWVLRKAMNPVLNQKVCWRNGKTDLSPIYERGLREYDSQHLEQLTNNIPENLECYLDKGTVYQVFKRFIDNKGNTTDFRLLWQIAILNSWLKNR